MPRLRLGVLISGRGSNLQALIEATADPAHPAEIGLVISNRADAAGLDRARRAGIPSRVIADTNREHFAAEAHHALRGAGIGFVALAGFMRILHPGFVEGWRDRMVNIHPSLLPAFPGLGTHRQALDAGVLEHGATVHFVTAQLDHGPAIAQARIEVRPGDTEETLATRLLVEEHKLYPYAIRLFVEDRLSIVDDQVVVAETHKI